jgi:hypothetical protein
MEFNINKMASSLINQRNKAFGIMIIGALLAFEIFNYSTTEFALNDVLGNLTFAGLRWATILSIAFCGIDFAGIARLFTPEQGADEPTEVWYLFGAWVLAAAMNAVLTWWGVSVAIANHTSAGTTVVSSATIQTVVPIFVAVMVWIIRILVIGTFSMAGERMLGQTASPSRRPNQQAQPQAPAPARNSNNDYRRPNVPAVQPLAARPILAPASSFKPQPKPQVRNDNGYSFQPQPARPQQTQQQARTETTYARPAEPTYHNLASNHQAEQYEERG